ncbi:sporulation protein YqfD [Viridibacillus sp. YIM B01967]|uniref:Sporulation protein YqfD n=1 Tax=Viridibacillus soli TaxID=2798301 RepID=A0ABS1H1Z3_9BACL|nr:sporulation protein YqfD [Viridibacillus soli]MBK3493326.1 sporulation protein YqfD [Viridibacillus soli]
MQRHGWNNRKLELEVTQNDRLPGFLRALAKANIPLKKMKTTKHHVTFQTTRKHLPVIRKLRRKYHMKMTIDWLDEEVILRNEWLVHIGLLLLIIVPLCASQFIWSVDIDASTPEQEEELQKSLYILQISPPFLKSKLPDETIIRQQILQDQRELSWVHIHQEGSNLTFSPIPSPKLETEIVEKEQPSHLIAKKSGVITHFNLTKGERAVEENKAVYTGDLLVTGILKQGEKEIVYGAEGEVFADYWIEASFTLPRTIDYKVPGERHYELRWKKDKVKKGDDWQNVKLPKWLAKYVELSVTQQSTTKQLKLDEQSVEKVLLPLLHQKYVNELPSKTVMKREKLLQVAIDNDTVKGKVLFLVNENIAVKQVIYQGD